MLKQAFSSEGEQSEAWQNVSIVRQRNSRVRGRPGLTLTFSSSCRSHYMGDWVPGSGLASTQDRAQTSATKLDNTGLNTQYKDKAHKTVAAQEVARGHGAVLMEKKQSVNCKLVSPHCLFIIASM